MHDLPETKPGLPGRLYEKWARRFTASRIYPSGFRYNLTIGDRPRFVWFRVAKAGTRTIFAVLRNAGVSFAAENLIFRHYRPALHRNEFKFAFVRDPVGRFLSCWRDRVLVRNHFGFGPEEHARMQNLGEFIAYAEGVDVERCDVHLRLQTRLVDLDNLDFLGRMESFGEDVHHVLSRLGLPTAEVPRQNASGRRVGAPVDPTAEQRRRIASIYERDIRILGYRES